MLVPNRPNSNLLGEREAHRRSYAYGTLPGHREPAKNASSFEHLDDGRILFTITASSQPASALARLGGPTSRAAQLLMAQRYLSTLDRL